MKLKKLTSAGIGHLMPLLFVLVIGVVGSIALVVSHAQTPPPPESTAAKLSCNITYVHTVNNYKYNSLNDGFGGLTGAIVSGHMYIHNVAPKLVQQWARL